MSAIDELKDGVVLDTMLGQDGTESDSDEMVLDATSGDVVESKPTRIDLSKVDRSPKPKTKITVTSNKRKTVDINDIVDEEVDKEDAEVHISPVMDIVDPENPNSLLSKYVAKKDEEAREWIAQKEEEKAVMDEENIDGLDIDTTNDGGSLVYDDSVSTDDDINYELDDDIDISSIMDDEGEDRMEPKDNEMDLTAADVGEIDIEPLDIEDEDEVEETTDDAAETPVAEKKEEVPKKEEYGAEDIEVAEDTREALDLPIIEEESTDMVGDTDDMEVLKHLQKLATEKLKPVSNKLDISSFTVLKKPVTNINPIYEETSSRVVKWVLPTQESVVLMKEFSGSELEKLREYSENSSSMDSLNRRFKMIYDHIVSPKPATFEAWLKTTPYEDVDHYFFAIYVACFKGANYLPEDCPNKDCGKAFLTDDVNIMDMVKFDTKEAKKKFTELYQSEATPAGKGVYCTEIVPMNNKIAISFRQPSIHNIFEIASLDDRTRNNYSAIIEYIPFIDTIYMIDNENQQLIPITYKMFPDNAHRTIRSKMNKYDSIFKTLSVDEFGPIKAYVRAIAEKSVDMHYVYPAAECPICHSVTEERGASAEELVFTRYQLGSLVTTSLS